MTHWQNLTTTLRHAYRKIFDRRQVVFVGDLSKSSRGGRWTRVILAADLTDLDDDKRTPPDLITSAISPQRVGHRSMHMPVLDIDYPVHVVPSSTPGHYHLYLNQPVSWEHYLTVLSALADAGLIERGYHEASRRQGMTTVRLPWIKKEHT